MIVNGCDSLKDSISNFKREILFWESLSNSEFELNSTINAIKKITFLEVIKNKIDRDNYFLCSLVSDLILTISTLELNQERYFYFNLRSAIENYLRFILVKQKNDKTGVRNLFNEFELKDKELRDNLNSYYSVCCNYVHNNSNASLISIDKYVQVKSMPFSNIKNAISVLNGTVNIFLIYLITSETEIIDYSFHRNKLGMKYLIGEKLFNEFNKSRV